MLLYYYYGDCAILCLTKICLRCEGGAVSLYPTQSLLSSSSLVFSLETHSCLLPLASQFSTSDWVHSQAVHFTHTEQWATILILWHPLRHELNIKRKCLINIYIFKSLISTRSSVWHYSFWKTVMTHSLENSVQIWLQTQFLDLTIACPHYSSNI